jgi:hypothetical protein
MKIMALFICAICFHGEPRENSIEESVYLLTNSIIDISKLCRRLT